MEGKQDIIRKTQYKKLAKVISENNTKERVENHVLNLSKSIEHMKEKDGIEMKLYIDIFIRDTIQRSF